MLSLTKDNVKDMDNVKSQKGLNVEVEITTNPLIIIKDALACYTDAEIIQHLLVLNREVLKDLGAETNMKIAQNSSQCHPVIELPPSAHKAAIEVGFLYMGLQI